MVERRKTSINVAEVDAKAAEDAVERTRERLEVETDPERLRKLADLLALQVADAERKRKAATAASQIREAG